MQKVKTAVAGCGMISSVYIENALHQFSILDIAGCCDINPEAAGRASEAHGIPVLSMEEILEDPSIEMVINLTTPKAHYDVIKQLLMGGKHVYTEKVLAVGLEKAKELTALADEKNLYLGVSPDTFLGSAIQTGRFVLDSGMIGEPTGCLAVLNRDNRVGAEFIPYITQEGGGIAFDVGIYFTTALSYLLGPVEKVSGFMMTREPVRKHMYPFLENFDEAYEVKCENQAAGTLKYKNGVLGTVLFNSECIMNDYPELTIFGTQGILYLSNPDFFGGDIKVLIRGNKEPVLVPQNHGYSENARGVGAAEMAWSIRAGRKPMAGKEMALHSLEIIHGIEQSGREGKTYEMKTTFERPRALPKGYLKKSEFADFTADQEAALV